VRLLQSTYSISPTDNERLYTNVWQAGMKTIYVNNELIKDVTSAIIDG